MCILVLAGGRQQAHRAERSRTQCTKNEGDKTQDVMGCNRSDGRPLAIQPPFVLQEEDADGSR